MNIAKPILLTSFLIGGLIANTSLYAMHTKKPQAIKKEKSLPTLVVAAFINAAIPTNPVSQVFLDYIEQCINRCRLADKSMRTSVDGRKAHEAARADTRQAHIAAIIALHSHR